MRQAQSIARALGIGDAFIAEYPGVIPNDSTELFEQKVRECIVPGLREGFATIAAPSVAAAEPDRCAVVFTGTLDQVQEHFTQQLWTDGLPIIPPTPERLAEFLRYTDRDADEVLGVLAPEYREATVWNVAVNGVMAGCRPEYLPILIAAVEAIADPEFRLEDAGATPGWEPLVIVSGQLSRALDFNTEGGMMRVGRQANASIGRFLRLYMRNVAGLRTPPGGTDKGSIGLNFNVALAENEEAIAAVGWPAFRVDQGFDAEDNVVTVQSVVAISPPIYSGGNGAIEHLEMIAQIMATTCGPWSFTGVWYKRWHPLLVMSPSVAHAFAADGWSKDDIRRYLYETLKIEAHWLERYPMHVAGAEQPLAELVRDRNAPALYVESDDPDRLVPILLRPEWTNILLAGDPGRNQCKVYVNNHEQGPPISKKVRLPADWSHLRNGGD
jgi:hypothetical protein